MTSLLALDGVAGRFWPKAVVVNGCWQWQGNLSCKGYGRISIVHPDGKKRWHYAHRLAYKRHKGEIPKGMWIDHLCRNRGCINPDHLEAVSPKENILRGESFAAENAKKTCCVNGHEFNEANTYTRKSGGRDCRKCLAAAQRRRYAKVRDTA